MITTMSKPGASDARPKRIREFYHCPSCGRRGLYRLQPFYYRCRYCGTYRLVKPPRDG